MAPAPLSLQKLTYDAAAAKVFYHTSYNPYFKDNTTLWDAVDFIATLTPGPWTAQGRRSHGWRQPTTCIPWGVRYLHSYGLYASRRRARWSHWPHVASVAPTGWKDLHPEGVPPDPGPAEPLSVPQQACRSAWAKLIAKVYEVDPLICPRCGHQMSLIALITDPSQVRKILRHLLNIGRAPPGLDPTSLD